ncbi:hypothetical protein [Glutamicibacter creatinolyticus]|uniref:hypothetical protein n=1 Tax=Glutamicibacter creatinolyticus TaxID=162496 RepID=UPI001586B65A|nr:hypothetical protein [Glutamicibacter creatinolyticus]
MGDVDVGEDRLIELAAGSFAGVEIQLVGVFKQIDVRVEELSSAGEITVYLAELLGGSLPVAGDLPEPLADAFLRERSIGGQIEEVVLFDAELGQLVFQVLAEQLLRGSLIVQGTLDVAAHGGDECRAEANRLVVFGDGVFDAVDRRIGGVAGVVLYASAEEVPIVGVAVPAGGALRIMRRLTCCSRRHCPHQMVPLR